jgi:hypothetical protein
VMPSRRNAHPKSLDEVVAALPGRFREIEIHATDGAMTALKRYTRDLSDHLRQVLGPQSDPPTVEVMTMLGIPPSEWYRAVFTQR